MSSLQSFITTAVLAASTVNAAAALGSYNVDPDTVSVSGLSAGGFMAAQLGVAYSGTFKTGFGVFAGGPFDCARNQAYSTCMYNENPSITTPTANMKSWSGNQIDPVSNLEARQVYMEVGSADTTVGPNVMAQLKAQLANFDSAPNVSYVTTSGAGHTFPTNFNGAGDNSCGTTGSPYISNCNYDGAGAALQWMYGTGLNAPNTGTLGGSVLSFAQTGSYGASGMDTTGYLYVPKSCQGGSTVCRLHVALHGCLQSYSNIQMDFVSNTGYNKWADTNNIIVLYPQAIADNTIHTIADGTELSNPNACFDWVGWYGTNFDQKGGVQMVAMVNMVDQITKGYTSGNPPPPATTTTGSQPTKTTSSIAPTGSGAPLYGQCGGYDWTGPTTCAEGVCTAYSTEYAQCLPASK